MKESGESRAVTSDPGIEKKPSTSNVHPLIEGILKNFCQPVKGNKRQDGADLAFDSSQKERWS